MMPKPSHKQKFHLLRLGRLQLRANMQYFTVPPYSTWNPHGIHVEYVHSIWHICGFHMDSMWNEYIPWIPHGFHMECTYSTWIPCGINLFHIDTIHCFTINKHLDIIILY